MAAIFAEAQVPYAKIMGCAKLVTVPREFPAWLGRAQGAKPVFKSVSGLSGPNFWPDVPVQASCLTRRIVHHVGGLSKLAGCRTRPFGLGRIPAPLHEIRQRPVSSWSPGAHGRGRPWHPLGSDPRSLCARLEVFRASCQIGRAVRNGNADLEDSSAAGSRVFFYVCSIKPFFALDQLCMTRLRLSTALGRLTRPPSMRSSVG